ncbi:5'-methylthioadenosine/S-adenosylhomocysteine nucleosidase 1 isoform X2 [Dendrobium catenatum]|uniref:5'-methylthioadenosine/S-adenosylhomocysteine nucleosidase 1 isoform X2 n=1 Tax=Dendrobium catenatum TaxID=906689 RepID=UPI0009F65481|nr:5'-methylthioadenosine/S-adenosylhomocysteine nucleosidase 1 isoform X2 [Dendrobium catenatum]
MPSPEETNGEHPSAAIEADATGGADEATRQPISTVVIIIAMQTEALPLVSKFQLSEDTDGILFPKGVPWVRYHGKYKDLNINLVWPGKDLLLGVDSVGTVSASLVTYASIQALKPDLVINAGTAGGFKAKGASIGDVYMASDVAFHDRRIPIPVFDQYGIGARRSFCTPNLLKEVDLKGAAVAYVADLLSVPAIFIKAVTDIIDGEKPTAEEFLQNLVAVTANLDQAVTQAIYFINGRCLSDL